MRGETVGGYRIEREIGRGGQAVVYRAMRVDFGQLASAPDHAHAQGVVHRDSKPTNVLLGGNRYGYLADFGLSRHAHAPVLTPVGAWIGTPEYVAPEVLRGEGPSAASDRYAFALLAYEALTGQIAFPRSTPAAIIYSHLNDPPPHAFDARPELGRKASGELAKGMDKRPGRRPGSSVELIERLGAAIDATPGAPAAAPPRGRLHRSGSCRPDLPRRRARAAMSESPDGFGACALGALPVPVLPWRRLQVWPVGVRGVGGPLPGGSGPAGEAPIAAAGIAPVQPAPVAEVSEAPPPERPERGGRRDRAECGRHGSAAAWSTRRWATP